MTNVFSHLFPFLHLTFTAFDPRHPISAILVPGLNWRKENLFALVFITFDFEP